jgi:hypothetical protein
MPNPFGLPEATQPKLSNYRWSPSGQGGSVVFEWSDGTVTEKPASQADAMAMVAAIQKNGGFKPGDFP